MKKLEHWGIKLPLIIVCENRDEAKLVREKGIPYIIRPEGWDDDKILRAFLWKYVKDYFGDVSSAGETIYVEVPSGYRCTNEDAGSVDDFIDNFDYAQTAVDENGDGDWRISDGEVAQADDHFDTEEEWLILTAVDKRIGEGIDATIEALQDLNLLPEYISDVATAIRTEVCKMNWQDGWNRKLDAYLGDYQGSEKKKNLIIIDVSASIPRRISTALVRVVETMRDRCQADLLIHSSGAWYYPIEEPLPPIEKIMVHVGWGNETLQFYNRLSEHVFGKAWGNIIVFGDYDCPTPDPIIGEHPLHDMSGTTVDQLIVYRVNMQRSSYWGSRCMDTPDGVAATASYWWDNWIGWDNRSEVYTNKRKWNGADATTRAELVRTSFKEIVTGYALWILALDPDVPVIAKDIR